MKSWAPIVAVLSVAFLLAGCSIRRVGIRQVVPVIADGMAAFESESDLDYAAAALPGNLKLLEALRVSDPANDRLDLLLAQGYGSYALAFLQDPAERLEFADYERSRILAERARDFYRRCRDRAMDVLRRHHPRLVAALDEGGATLDRELARLDDADVPMLFWTAYGWGSLVNLSRDDIGLVAQAPLVVRLMERVLELDETYFFAGAHLFFGAWYGSVPKALGGRPDEAAAHFDRANEINDGRFLLVEVYRARYLATQLQDRNLFTTSLTKVLEAPDDLFPSQSLANTLAKRKAAWLLDNIDEFF